MSIYLGGQKINPTTSILSREPITQELNIKPSTLAQTITATGGIDGYSPINVSAVTSDIDNNILAKNIKKGVSILGVNGDLEFSTEEITINPTIEKQIKTPTTDGYSKVTVNAVDANIDNNIKANNIKKDVTILGVTGTLESGIIPTGTINITENGVVDVTTYATANVNVPSNGIGIPREVSSTGVYQKPTQSFTFSLPRNAKDIGDYSLYYAFYDCDSLTSVDLSSLTTINGSYAMHYAFYNCDNLTSIDLSNLTTITGSYAMQRAFYNCDSLTSVDLSSLTTINGSCAMYYAFCNCDNLTNVDLSNLTTITGNVALAQCFVDTNLKELSFPSLNSQSFGSNNTQFNFMLRSVDGCVVHFPSNLESVIGSWASVQSGFGGTNTEVLFDLPATT